LELVGEWTQTPPTRLVQPGLCPGRAFFVSIFGIGPIEQFNLRERRLRSAPFFSGDGGTPKPPQTWQGFGEPRPPSGLLPVSGVNPRY
jgi:hypothetical protein